MIKGNISVYITFDYTKIPFLIGKQVAGLPFEGSGGRPRQQPGDGYIYDPARNSEVLLPVHLRKAWRKLAPSLKPSRAAMSSVVICVFRK
jgi:hypothetical protein